MNSIKRNGVDIEAALSLASKRLLARNVSSPGIGAPADVAIDLVDANFSDAVDVPPHARTKTSLILRHHVKQALRRIARNVFRAGKPFVRPVLFRLRNYFNATLRQDMLQEFVTLQHEFATIKQELATTHQEFVTLRHECTKLQDQQREHTQQIMLELQRLANSASVQTSLSQELVASQLPLEKAGPQLDRIEHYALLDVNRIAINSGPDETLVKTAVGYVLCAANDHALLANLMEAGELEPGTRILIERLLKPGDVYIDVGANIGLHSIAAARAMSGQGKIFAFEPFEPTRKLLERNLWLNGFSSICEISHFALSDTTGKHKLHLGATSGHHSLYELETPAFTPTTSVDISTITLDEFLPEKQTARLLKIDAEGAEIDVIKGAKRLLAGNPQMLLIVELGLSHLKRNAISLENWIEHFTSQGLSFSVINDRTGDLEDWSVEQLSHSESVNLLFHRPASTQPRGSDA
jgi:FkbM family methyltransferase